jgi:hypothetical protein
MPRASKTEKPTKTETLAIRLDPKVKYGLEILAREQRRSITSLVEWVINDALRTHLRISYSTDKIQTEGGGTYRRSYDEFVLDYLWDSDEVIRLIKLADYNPDLLTYEENKVWNLIQENAFYWVGKLDEKKDRFIWDTSDISSLRIQIVQAHFQELKEVANSQKDMEQIDLLFFHGTGIGGDRLTERYYNIHSQDELELFEAFMPLSAGLKTEAFEKFFIDWATKLVAKKGNTKAGKGKKDGQKV